jgi:hypothetical protein
MLAMERHAPVRHAAMRLLAARPNLFSRLLMIRAGALTLATLQGATE